MPEQYTSETGSASCIVVMIISHCLLVLSKKQDSTIHLQVYIYDNDKTGKKVVMH
jgi:hypothetical protein